MPALFYLSGEKKMKYYLYYIRANRHILILTLLICVFIDLCIVVADLPNAGVKGFWIPVLIALGLTVLVMGFLLIVIFCFYIKSRSELEIMDKSGVCEELIQAYKHNHPRPNSVNRLVLASYYMALERLEEAERELTIVGASIMTDMSVKGLYSELFVSMRIHQHRFDEAILMYKNYENVMEVYCRSHKNALNIEHYANGAVLYACSGNFEAAMECIRRSEKAVKKERYLAFTRNTALMSVYLLAGDYAKADEIKNMMFRDLETFDGFPLGGHKKLAYKDIADAQKLYDPRVQTQ